MGSRSKYTREIKDTPERGRVTVARSRKAAVVARYHELHRLRAENDSSHDRVADALDFFLDALCAWREVKALEDALRVENASLRDRVADLEDELSMAEDDALCARLEVEALEDELLRWQCD